MPLKPMLILLLALTLAGCSEEPKSARSADLQPATNVSAVSSPRHAAETYTLLFFLDPNGGPCQMQQAILKDMAGELEGTAVRYVQTTVPSDLDYFYSFGVRGLPTLLLADASGKEIRRLTPGVKTADEIRDLLQTASDK